MFTALRCLSEACSISLQFTITSADIKRIEFDVEQWHNFLKKHDSTDLFTVNQHSLEHLAFIIKKQGPLRYFSARPLERLIGLTKSTIRSDKNSRQNAVNEMNKSFAANYYSKSVHGSRSFLFPLPGFGASAFHLGAQKSLKLSTKSTKARTVQFGAALSSYFI